MKEETPLFIPMEQINFANAFLSPESPTTLNIAKSAKQANLPLSTAQSLAQLKTKWFKELAEESPLLHKAEENLAQILDLPVTDYDHGQTVAKVSMFVAERLGKQRYSTRNEVTGENGKDIIPREEVEMRIINLRKKQIEE